MVKHIKKNYAKDGKLTDREKSIAYATAWKHHNEETEHTTHAKDVVKVDKDKLKATKSIKKDLDKVQEDARYKAAMGPGSMEWGTDVGDKYFRSLTPGQSSDNRKSLIKPLPIKARKPADEKGVKITEGVIGGAIGGAIGAKVGGVPGAWKGAKIGSAVGDAATVAAAGYGAYKAGKGVYKAGKAVGKGVKKVKDKITKKKDCLLYTSPSPRD